MAEVGKGGRGSSGNPYFSSGELLERITVSCRIQIIFDLWALIRDRADLHLSVP